MSATQDFVTLDWIKSELVQTLNRAQRALEESALVDESSTTSGEAPDSMRVCLSAIHQIHGTLKMVQLEGPALFAVEMENLAQALMNNSVPDVMQAQETLMQSILQMSAYLDRVQHEQNELPEVLNPIVNSLRAARGEESLTFADQKQTSDRVNFALLTDAATPQVIEEFKLTKGTVNTGKLRRRYQQALLSVLKKSSPRENLGLMGKVMSMLVKICGNSPAGNFFQLGLALVEGILAGEIKLDSHVVRHLKVILSVIKVLEEGDEQTINVPISESSAADIYLMLQQVTRETPKIVAALARFAPLEASAERGGLGPDDETLAAVALVLVEEFAVITDKLDLYVRSEGLDEQELIDLIPLMEKVASTLSMIGLTEQQKSIRHQIEVINTFRAGEEDPTEEQLLGVAAAILEIQSELNRLKGNVDEKTEVGFGDLDEAQAAVIRETRNGLAGCQDALVEYVSEEFAKEELDAFPEQLRSLAGGLTIVNQYRSAKVLEACSYYVERELLVSESSPDSTALDNLADAIVSVDYYLQQLLESNSDPYLKMVEVAETSIAKLGYGVDVLESVLADEELSETIVIAPEKAQANLLGDRENEMPPVDFEDAPGEESANINTVMISPAFRNPESEPQPGDEEPSAALEEEPSAALEEAPSAALDEPSAALEEEPSAALEEEPSTALEEAPSAVSDGEIQKDKQPDPDEKSRAVTNQESDVDDELMEIFAEEVTEVLENIGKLLPRWETDDDVHALTEIRRGFHTLKGSGLLVEANVIGELGRAIEDLLNRILDNSVVVGSEVFPLIREVIAAIPEGIRAFERGQQYSFNTDEFVQRAEALLSGDGSSGVDNEEEPSSDDVEIEFTPASSGDESSDIELDAEATFDLGEFELDSEEGEPAEEVPLEFGSFTEVVEEEGVDEADSILIDEVRENQDEKEIGQQATFDLSIVNLLGRPAEHLQEWRSELVANTVSELEEVQKTAAASGQSVLVELCTHMLEVYRQLADKPADLILKILTKAHGNLAVMLAAIADGQEVLAVSEILVELRSLDIEKLETDKELQLFAKDSNEVLGLIGPMLDDWSKDISNLMPVEQIINRLSLLEVAAESRQIKSMASTFELLVLLLEKLVSGHLIPNREDLQLLESGRAALLIQTEALKGGEMPDLDEKLKGLFRNRLETTAISTGNAETLPEDVIDEDVIALFLEEAVELLEAIDETILEWNNDTLSAAPLDNLLRHLHTLKGGARLAGLNSLGEVTHTFETFLTGVQQNPAALNDQFFAQLNERQDDIVRRVDIYNRMVSGSATEEELSFLRAPIGRDEDKKPADSQQADARVLELPEDAIDEEILSIFIEEADELIETIDQTIMDWSHNPSNSEYHDNLLRHLHTMKGGARLAGLNSLGEFSHNFETYLTSIQRNPIPMDESFFSLLNLQQDEITRRVEIYRKLVQGSVTEEELASLASAVEMNSDVARAELPETPLAVDETEAAIESREAETQAVVGSKHTQEMVRVSADLLEDLIGLAGETNITRGRIEQQISDFGDSLQEMEVTISRVREQVRRLEIEVESVETLYRGNAARGDSAFDELEMDRYTMLQEISRSLSEGTSDMQDLKVTLLDKSRDAEALLNQQARTGNELQEGLTRTRMVPFARLIPRLRRIVRQVSVEVNKSVRFEAFNVEGELDRNVLERIVAPLEHMLRNAVDHGIETTEERKLADKPETGRISLRLAREAGYVLLTVSDDGSGIDVDAVRRKAVEKGLLKPDAEVSDNQVMQFIMHAGFSTAEKLTQISGRGVGLDVVDSEIKQLGGSVEISSVPGEGTEFKIRIPFTVSINRALMVMIQDETYAIPLNTIEGIVRVSPYELEAYYQPDAPMFEYAGQPYVLSYMGSLVDAPGKPVLDGQAALLPVILARSGEQAVALQVDRVIGSREVVVKSLGPQFTEVGGVAGATVLGDGRVVIILDVPGMMRRNEIQQREIVVEPGEPVEKTRKIMIVDDSVTVRKVTSRLLLRHGWDVVTAKDGVDAIRLLQDTSPDLILLDIEMPRMDGFEVLRIVRRDLRFENLPIIMITSRAGEKHKQQAFELGVSRFLGKPFQEDSLIDTIDECISEATG